MTNSQQQIRLTYYSDRAPDPAGYKWQGFTLDTPEEDAAAAFVRRYGELPFFIFESLGLLLCGPIPSEVL